LENYVKFETFKTKKPVFKMNRNALFKQFLPGLLPLVIFILVDEFRSTKEALIIAIIFGAGQLGYTFIREKRLDKFTLFDTLLLVVLGGISLFLNNDIFFKLKPGFIGIIFCAILGISAFSKFNIMAKMSARYMQGMEFGDEQQKQFTRSIKILFFIFTFHTLLVFYAAVFMSKEAWGFISTALFYILFGVYFGFEFIRARIKANKYKHEEWLPLVDEGGNVTGKAPRSSCHSNKSFLHPVVHLHVFQAGKIYLQKRPATKQIQPGKWDTAVGGHISVGENIEAALNREAFEELGIASFLPQLFARYKWESEIETELVFMFVAEYNGKISFNPSELDTGRFWTIKEIKENLGKNVFTSNFELEFEMLGRQLKLK
jgi:isopentenyldiphosphate isomerase/intracellular septation protein A